MLVQKLLKLCEKTGESYIIEYRNCFYENPMWGKIKKQTLSYIDIASLKSIVRKL
jgi:hypothetical protein